MPPLKIKVRPILESLSEEFDEEPESEVIGIVNSQVREALRIMSGRSICDLKSWLSNQIIECEDVQNALSKEQVADYQGYQFQILVLTGILDQL